MRRSRFDFLKPLLGALALSTIIFCGGMGGGNGGSGGGSGGSAGGTNGGLRGVYVADSANHRIALYGTGSSQFFTLGTQGSGVMQFNNPNSVIVGSDGKIYVADTGNHRIVRMDDIQGTGWVSIGSQGSGQGQFNSPFALTFDQDIAGDHILVCDTQNHRIVKLDKNLSGSTWQILGTQGSGDLHFNAPQGITSGSGKIYVADTSNHRIVRINSIAGDGWTSFGSLGSGQNQFQNPHGIHLGPPRPPLFFRSIYISDKGNNRIVAITSTLGWESSFGSFGSGVGQFVGPSAVFQAESLRLIVCDQQNHRTATMDDMSGAGWTTFGSQGSGDNQFWYPVSVWRHETNP